MGTNFYDANPPRYADALDPEYHVCKRVSTGDGGMALLWAMTPERLKEITEGAPVGLRYVIVDENGRLYTKQEWLDSVLQPSSQKFDRVGEWFS